MIKKIKLYAHRHHSNIQFSDIENPSHLVGFTREPCWDKEIEVPDEVKKPREFWLAVNSENVNVIEKLPDHVMVSREQIEKIWNKMGYQSLESLDFLCKELGLEK